MKLVFAGMPERVFAMPPAYEFRGGPVMGEYREIEANKPLYEALDHQLKALGLEYTPKSAVAGR